MRRSILLSLYGVLIALFCGCHSTPNVDTPAEDEQSRSETNPAARNFMIREYRDRAQAWNARQEVAVNQSRNR